MAEPWNFSCRFCLFLGSSGQLNEKCENYFVSCLIGKKLFDFFGVFLVDFKDFLVSRLRWGNFCGFEDVELDKVSDFDVKLGSEAFDTEFLGKNLIFLDSLRRFSVLGLEISSIFRKKSCFTTDFSIFQKCLRFLGSLLLTAHDFAFQIPSKILVRKRNRRSSFFASPHTLKDALSTHKIPLNSNRAFFSSFNFTHITQTQFSMHFPVTLPFLKAEFLCRFHFKSSILSHILRSWDDPLCVLINNRRKSVCIDDVTH